MNPNTRLNAILILVAALLVGGNVTAFTYRSWGPAVTLAWTDYWNKRALKPAVKAGDRTIADCLGVSDFYSVHLTTYFLADSEENAGGTVDDLRRYDEYCDRVPGTGKVIFSVTFMEKEVRKERVGFSFFQTEASGELKEISSLPPKTYPSGMFSADTTIGHKGKYILRIAFGEGKAKEDLIDMPILVGQ
jgi:hypothetical protein